MRVLITGSQGQVGRSLVDLLSSRHDIEVFAYNREQLNIVDNASVQTLISELRPNVIINAAAYTAVDRAEIDADTSYNINRDGPLFLAKAAQKLNALLLHISTDYVFDGDSSMPYEETDAAYPRGVYGQSAKA